MEEMYLKKSSTCTCTLTPNNKNGFLLSCSPVQLEEVSSNMMEKQGIISLLGSDDCRGPKPAEAATSFRRTLSADMSSKTWLAQNGFRHPTMKKIASSGQLAIISTVLENKKQDDVWATIISQKKSDEIEPPPYVHPLLKKSNSTLSEKSLEICTENLGSETGSDGFSSSSEAANSEASDLDKEEESRHEEIKNYSGEEVPVVVAKYNYSAAADKKMMQKHRSFPPPLSSLTRSSNEGPCLHMHSQRVNGRLVLQAVAVPSTKKFQAQREDGRLRLTLLSSTTSEDEEHPVFDGAVADQKADDKQVEEDPEEMSEIFKEEDENNAQTDDEEEEGEEERSGQVEENKGSVMKLEAPKMKSGTINVHRSALMMKKLEAIENQNSTWSDNFNYNTPTKLVKDAMTKETTLLPRSLPPRPRVMPGTQAATAAAASYNSYEYFWRAKPATTGLKNEISQPVTTILTKQLTRLATTNLKNQLTRHCSPYNNNTSNGVIAVLKPKEYEHKEIVVLRNCNEARKSLLFWDAHCIATS